MLKNLEITTIPICGYCNEWRMLATICGPYEGIARNAKWQWLLWDLYAGIARMQYASGYYGTYMRVLQGCKMPAAIMGLICGYCNECKMPMAILGLICGYCKECKMPAAILRLICGYCIFENGLMEFIIENDVGIICLKCVYCFKSL